MKMHVGLLSGSVLWRRVMASNGQVAERAGLAVGTDVVLGSIPTEPAVQYIFESSHFLLRGGNLPVVAMPKS